MMIARAAALLLVCGTATAHDFWIQPDHYRAEPGSIVPLTLQVGHGESRQRSMLPLRRITRFEAVAPDGARFDMRDRLKLGGPSQDGELRLGGRGTYVVVLETDNRAQSYQPSVRFNNYLRDEGLAGVLRSREQAHRMDVDGSESYSRHSKALVLVGPSAAALAPGAASTSAAAQGPGAASASAVAQRPGAASASVAARGPGVVSSPGAVRALAVAPESTTQVTQPVGMALEIVPEVDPYGAAHVLDLPVRVLFEGRPLSGALVKLTNLDHDAEPAETHTTDEDGRSSFAMPNSGKWLLNVIWSKSRPATQETDFETYFSSLSFGW